MGKLGKLTDRLEHKLDAIAKKLSPELRPLWRRLRSLRDEALAELSRAIADELERRGRQQPQA